MQRVTTVSIRDLALRYQHQLAGEVVQAPHVPVPLRTEVVSGKSERDRYRRRHKMRESNLQYCYTRHPPKFSYVILASFIILH
jgi:hypothetical protein